MRPLACATLLETAITASIPRTAIAGVIDSDVMEITIPGLSVGDGVIPVMDVYVCPTGLKCLPVPFTLEGVVSSTYFLSTTTITLFNALSLLREFASTGAYIIIIVE